MEYNLKYFLYLNVIFHMLNFGPRSQKLKSEKTLKVRKTLQMSIFGPWGEMFKKHDFAKNAISPEIT